MKIGVDARLLERQMTGIGRYLRNLLRYISDFDKDDQFVLYTYKPLSVEEYSKGRFENTSTIGIPLKGLLQKVISPIWLNFILPFFRARDRADVFFAPNSLLPIVGNAKKNIIAVHDVFQLINKTFHSPLYRLYISATLTRSLKKADIVITISESSKRDIVDLLNVPQEKVRVTYLAAEERFQERVISDDKKAELMSRYNLPLKFVLYIGVIEKRKNIEGIIRIADILKEESDISVVLIGRSGYGGKEHIEEIRARKNMRYCGFTSDEDLPYIYNLAGAFLFPSHYEGFGLPPLEAMQSGVPVIASNTASLPEVVGDAGMLFPPEEYSAFARAVIKVFNDPKARRDLIEKGLRQAKKFSYANTARATAKIFDEIAGRKEI